MKLLLDDVPLHDIPQGVPLRIELCCDEHRQLLDEAGRLGEHASAHGENPHALRMQIVASELQAVMLHVASEMRDGKPSERVHELLGKSVRRFLRGALDYLLWFHRHADGFELPARVLVAEKLRQAVDGFVNDD